MVTDWNGEIMKKIGLFISSVFSEEMLLTRDLIKNELYVQMSNTLGEKFTNVYLRELELGIPKDCDRIQIIDTCLRSIDESEYFVGILDGKYGTPIAEVIEEDDINESGYQEIVRESYDQNISVLHLEILYALKKNKQVIFFVKDKVDLSGVSKILDLLSEYQLYNDIDEIVDGIHGFVDANIEDDESHRWLSKEQRAYVTRKLKYYCTQPEIELVYDYFRRKTCEPLLICGDYGVGKSTLIAKFVSEMKEEENVYYTAVGVGCRTVEDSIKPILESLLSKLDIIESNLNGEKEIVNDFEAVIGRLANLDKQFIIILDNLDDMISFDGIKSLYWIPKSIPENVKLVIASRSTESVNTSKKIILEPYDDNRIMQSIFNQEGKYNEISRIKDKLHDLRNPYIEQLISLEILALAKFDNIEFVLDEYDSCKTDSYQLISKYIERLSDRYGYQAVVDVMSLLSYTRFGITKSELEQLVNTEIGTLLLMLGTELHIDDNNRYRLSNHLIKYTLETYHNVEKDYYYEKLIGKQISNPDETCQLDVAYLAYELKSKKYLNQLFANIKSAFIIYKHNYELYHRIATFIGYSIAKDGLLSIDMNDDFAQSSDWLYYLSENGLNDDAIQLSENRLKSFKQNEFLDDYINELHVLGDLYETKNEYTKATKYYRECVELSKEHVGVNHIETLVSMNNIALVYRELERYDESEKMYRELIELIKQLDEKHPELGTVYNNFATCMICQERYEDAMNFFEKALDIRKLNFGDNSPFVADIINNMALHCIDLNDLEKSEKYFKKAESIYAQVYHKNHEAYATYLSNYSRLYIKRKDFNNALQCMDKATDIYSDVFGYNSREVAWMYRHKAQLHDMFKKSDEAIPYYSKAISISKKHNLLKDVYDIYLDMIDTCFEIGLNEKGNLFTKECLEYYYGDRYFDEILDEVFDMLDYYKQRTTKKMLTDKYKQKK